MIPAWASSRSTSHRPLANYLAVPLVSPSARSFRKLHRAAASGNCVGAWLKALRRKLLALNFPCHPQRWKSPRVAIPHSLPATPHLSSRRRRDVLMFPSLGRYSSTVIPSKAESLAEEVVPITQSQSCSSISEARRRHPLPYPRGEDDGSEHRTAQVFESRQLTPCRKISMSSRVERRNCSSFPSPMWL